MGGLFIFFLIYGIINLCKDAYIHDAPVFGSEKDIITIHPERYRNYLECQKICKKILKPIDRKCTNRKAGSDYRII